MPRKLKTYLTTSGFFELAVAAPSMKAALEIWGSKSNQFQQGFAKETTDPEIVGATMAQPGVVLRRPIGSRGPFKQEAELPKVSALAKASKSRPELKTAPKKEKKQPAAKADAGAGKKAAQLYDLAQKRREREERQEQQERQRQRERREAAIAKAEAALEAAREKHAERLAGLEKEKAVLDRKLRFEKERWQEEKQELDSAIKRAGD